MNADRPSVNRATVLLAPLFLAFAGFLAFELSRLVIFSLAKSRACTSVQSDTASYTLLQRQ
jgi:hypothetical protein